MNQRGDTIVEVLIAIAVVGAVLGGAFTATRRSLLSAQMSNERGEAVKFAEAQVEGVQAALKDEAKADQIFSLGGFFCLTDAQDIQTNVNSNDCRRGPGGRYSLSIRGVGLPSVTGREFTVSAVWDRVDGAEQEERVDIVYRAYRSD